MTTWTPPGAAWLFCPADRPERFAKAAAVADVVILDLEDGVAPADKAAAREALAATPLDPNTTVVRINAAGTDDHKLDLRALESTEYRRVMLPKCESPQQVFELALLEVIVLIESPMGAVRVAELVHQDNVVAVMWGAEDLVAGLGGNASRHDDGSYRDVARHVRSATLLAGKAYEKFVLDAVYLNIKDLDGLRAESLDAVAVGFDGKVAIHPSQVPVIRQAYEPSASEADWAARVLKAAETERGVFAFEGRMVDSPVLRHAERIVRRTGAR
ncbi:CoA ester lyase [Skermania sp. ID1734]|uniref:HpcH/HpaI aldolase/citrate lyase family protein n=1 Tax=Skermania sp. ID1734 TaxID=2597516 RepID=UPI00117D5A29|nr:CoA ester lyase [Skermania sp. ID1734]TSE02169.1 CoA ester lyase [Skermania sp. ID1734]